MYSDEADEADFHVVNERIKEILDVIQAALDRYTEITERPKYIDLALTSIESF